MERTSKFLKPSWYYFGQRPMIVHLHGGMSNGDTFTSNTDLINQAKGFCHLIVEGTSGLDPDARTWNSGGCCGAAFSKKIDDVSYIKEEIQEAIDSGKVDPKRIYAVGMSNGAMMGYRLACEIPEFIAGVVSVAGTLGVDDCSKAKGVRVYHLHGDADENVPFYGGVGKDGFSGVSHRSVPEAINMMLAPRGKIVTHHKTSYGIKVDTWTYDCTDGASIQLDLVHGMGHTWPKWPLNATQKVIEFCEK